MPTAQALENVGTINGQSIMKTRHLETTMLCLSIHQIWIEINGNLDYNFEHSIWTPWGINGDTLFTFKPLLWGCKNQHNSI